MLKVATTRHGKKDLAVSYGFLVDVWTAQQNKNGIASMGLKRCSGKKQEVYPQ